MKRALFRLFAYTVAGTSLGAAAWFALFVDTTAADISITIVLVVAAGGVGVAIILLKRAAVVVPRGTLVFGLGATD